MGLPWIGETMEFYKAQRTNKLFEEFVQPRIHKYGKIFKTWLMGSPTVVVNGPDTNRFFLSNEFKLSVQLMGNDSIMEKQGEQHWCLRGIIASSSFSCAGHEGMMPKICDSCLLGINVEPQMLGIFERVLEGVFAPPIRVPGSKFSRAKKAREEIERVLIDVVREKKEEERENKPHDTTSFAIAMTFRMLAHHPNCFSLLLQEHADILSNKRAGEYLTMEDTKKMKYTWQVVRESIRLFPPIFGSFRKAISDIEYEGFIIPKGWKVLWTTYATHYNEDYFPDHMAFDPSRFEEPIQPYVFLPFGGGPRMCAGYQLAKLNILIFVHFVVTHYNWSHQYLDEPITMDPLPFPSHGMPINIYRKKL
ncbi:hypothetical protein RHMOL_Rhmol06G0161600 [Rhododendron molle]|uniref:Uncharacterized protein n=1 Tax=Rhododendron molle TaxID=49168 RepID=A0ACC0NDP2_RHOML|nr:hypothetical protein RHMOL_Rhmol06G0161600 [Rhododendron molle]